MWAARQRPRRLETTVSALEPERAGRVRGFTILSNGGTLARSDYEARPDG